MACLIRFFVDKAQEYAQLNAPPNSLDRLTDDALGVVFSNLSIAEQAALSSVSKRCQKIVAQTNKELTLLYSAMESCQAVFTGEIEPVACQRRNQIYPTNEYFYDFLILYFAPNPEEIPPKYNFGSSKTFVLGNSSLLDKFQYTKNCLALLTGEEEKIIDEQIKELAKKQGVFRLEARFRHDYVARTTILTEIVVKDFNSRDLTEGHLPPIVNKVNELLQQKSVVVKKAPANQESVIRWG